MGEAVNVRFIDMFGGVGGFRLGLEKASHIKSQSEKGKSKEGRNGSTDECGTLFHGGQHTTSSCEELCDKDKDIPQPACADRSEGGQCGKPTDISNKGFTCVGYYELDKYCVQVYNKNFGESHNPTDVRSVDWSREPDFNLLCAGFPCQSFSIAGKRRGFEDTRGTLFFEIVRCIREKQPSLLLLENVRGLLNHDQGRTFRTILDSLDECGYDAEWNVLNSKGFEVPQNRERVFIIGHLRGKCGGQVFPLGEGGCSPSERVTGAVTADYWKGNHTGSYVEKIQKEKPVMIHNVYGGFNEGIRTFEDYSPTIRTPKGGGHLPMIVENFYPERVREYSEDSPTLRTGRVGLKVVESTKIRRLTPVECARLQGFPDNWHEGMSDTQAYRQYGNAVTTNVITAIGRRILEIL